MINYETLLYQALRRLVHKVLAQTVRNGLISPHHFYIEFLTTHKGVVLPNYLKAQYPETMAIVLEHQFYDLAVTRKDFTVTLCFNGLYENVTIPFKAITAFIDPGVKFGLSFQPKVKEPEGPNLSPRDNVIQLDKFRPTDKNR